MTSNLAALAWRNVRSRRMRSWLTILGIMIGVMAVITLISVGTGVEKAVLRQFEDIGLDIVLLTPTTGLRLSQHAAPSEQSSTESPQMITETPDHDHELTAQGLDLVRLRRDVPEITAIGQIATRVLPISAGARKGLMRVLAPSHKFMDLFPSLLGGFLISAGRRPDPAADREVLLGALAALQTKLPVGGSVHIAGITFSVVGALAPSDRTQEVIGGDHVPAESAEIIGALAVMDNAVFVPYETAAALWPDQLTSSMVAMRIRTGVSVTETIQKINAALVQQGASMTPISTQVLADNVQRTLGMIKTVLASIAAISLLVGAVGMMNTMYTAVLERTCEIGILKSVGAKDRQVLGIFLIDSGLMGAVGGLLGVMIGIGVSIAGTSAFGRLLGVTSFSPSFPPWLVIGALAASFLLGALAGAWPAWQASRLDPVRALRAL